jgi:hypothetical protein
VELADELRDHGTFSILNSWHGALIEIDRYGERLIGCVACNRWGWPGDKNLIMALPEEDIAALRQRATPSRQQARGRPRIGV